LNGPEEVSAVAGVAWDSPAPDTVMIATSVAKSRRLRRGKPRKTADRSSPSAFVRTFRTADDNEDDIPLMVLASFKLDLVRPPNGGQL
jgi:hypothetical protein